MEKGSHATEKKLGGGGEYDLNMTKNMPIYKETLFSLSNQVFVMVYEPRDQKKIESQWWEK
jgi:hypothetical protein